MRTSKCNVDRSYNNGKQHAPISANQDHDQANDPKVNMPPASWAIIKPHVVDTGKGKIICGYMQPG